MPNELFSDLISRIINYATEQTSRWEWSTQKLQSLAFSFINDFLCDLSHACRLKYWRKHRRMIWLQRYGPQPSVGQWYSFSSINDSLYIHWSIMPKTLVLCSIRNSLYFQCFLFQLLTFFKFRSFSLNLATFSLLEHALNRRSFAHASKMNTGHNSDACSSNDLKDLK